MKWQFDNLNDWLKSFQKSFPKASVEKKGFNQKVSDQNYEVKIVTKMEVKSEIDCNFDS